MTVKSLQKNNCNITNRRNLFRTGKGMDTDFVVRAALSSASLCLLLSLLGLGLFILARVRAAMPSASSSMHQNHSSCSTLTLIEQRSSFATFLSFSIEPMEHHTKYSWGLTQAVGLRSSTQRSKITHHAPGNAVYGLSATPLASECLAI